MKRFLPGDWFDGGPYNFRDGLVIGRHVCGDIYVMITGRSTVRINSPDQPPCFVRLRQRPHYVGDTHSIFEHVFDGPCKGCGCSGYTFSTSGSDWCPSCACGTAPQHLVNAHNFGHGGLPGVGTP